jgi:hypothetical protein
VSSVSGFEPGEVGAGLSSRSRSLPWEKTKLNSTQFANALRCLGLFVEANKYRMEQQESYIQQGGQSAVTAKKLSWADMYKRYMPQIEASAIDPATLTSGDMGGDPKGMDNHERMVAALRPEQREAYEALVHAALDKPSVKPGRQMDWAFNNFARPWEHIDPESVPDFGALGALLSMKNDSRLYADLLGKRAATTAQMQKDQLDGGDDADVESMFEMVAETLKGEAA